MSGILSPRRRIVDFVLTSEGRKDLASGRLDISFATFSDAGTYYQSGSDGTRVPMSPSFTFESHVSEGDVITLEKNLDGSLTRLLDSSARPASSVVVISETSAEARTEVFDGITLRTGEILDGLSLLKNDTSFLDFDSSILQSTDSVSISQVDYLYGETASINDVAYVFADNRFKNFNSFKFLPPVVEKQNSIEPVFNFVGIPELFGFTAFNPQTVLSYSSFDFYPSRQDSNISVAAQFFEFNEDIDGKSQWSKLDMFYYGSTVLGDGSNAHVFFLGKRILRDSAFSFVTLFTMLVRY
jgi:hypothetical protein